MIWIISGPTSVGKSTFIASGRAREITGVPIDAPVILPGQDNELPSPEGTDCFFHYNILRPTSLFHRTYDKVKIASTRFEDDPKWVDLVRRAQSRKAVVLVADRATIVARVRSRSTREKTSTYKRAYNSEQWLAFLDKIDLDQVYRDWCAELDRHSIPRILIDSSDSHFKILESLP